MKHKIAVIASALFMALTMTACGASEPASAPSVAETDIPNQAIAKTQTS